MPSSVTTLNKKKSHLTSLDTMVCHDDKQKKIQLTSLDTLACHDDKQKKIQLTSLDTLACQDDKQKKTFNVVGYPRVSRR